MTTKADDSSRMDQTATSETTDAMTDAQATRGARDKRAPRGKAPEKPQAARVTQQLPAIALGPGDESRAKQEPDVFVSGAARQPEEAEVDDGATREVAAIPSGAFATPPEFATPPDYGRFAPTTAPEAESDDPDATIMRAQPRPDTSILDQPMTEPARPRYHTLASTFNRSRASASSSDPAAPMAQTPPPSEPITPPAPPVIPADAQAQRFAESDEIEDILDEVVDSDDDWALADQPTVQWTPQQIQQIQQLRPDFLQTGEQQSWPPRPDGAYIAPESDASHHDWRMGLPPRPRPPFPLNGAPRPNSVGEQRFAAPNGRVAPEPPSASTAGAQPDPRMERFQELRRQRFAHVQGERTDDDPLPMADAVRQWWNDLRPGVQSALNFQREARASGMHPIPAYESATVARLGDAFGRLAASARELSDRAQQAAAPTIKRIHDQVEQAAQGLISRFEGDNVRQQAPLLGPGRIAIFFRQGVTVGQAQRLLAASAARPMRLIPRKHGFLARVLPGKEAEVCERLRLHPYVRDVAYLEYNEYGDPVGGRR